MPTRTHESSFTTVSGVAADRVVNFRIDHRLAIPTEASVDVHLPDEVDPGDLVGIIGRIEFGYEGEPSHLFDGTIESVTMVGAPGDERRGHLYRFHLVSVLEPLSRVVTSQIFQELDVKEIVQKVLEQNGIPSDRQKWKLNGSYPKREYCVQYRESSLAFISRLLEEEGIYFFSDVKSPEEGGELLVFADDSPSAEAISGDEEIPFRAEGGFDRMEDSILAIVDRRRVVSGKFVLRDYDFEKPKLDLTSTAESDVDTALEIYDYPGGYFVPAEGKRLVKVRLQAEQAERSTVEIEGDCKRIAPGKKLKIGEASALHVEGEFFVTSVSHEMTRLGDGFSADGGESYRTHATLLPLAVHFRPRQLTPVPIIHGPQTARVVAPAGSQEEEIHTDKHGRAKVKFHWDLGPEMDDKASCWMRVSQLQTSGSMVLPRLRWEVVVEYLEGNPDRPIVTGRLYNGLYMPPYALPEGKSRTAMQSASTPGGGGRNEIRFEDKAGGEEIAINAQYDVNMSTANNKTHNVGKNQSRAVKVDSSMKVGSNSESKISKGFNTIVKADQSLTVGANRSVEVNAVAGLTVGGASNISIGGNVMEMDGNPLEALIALAVQKAAEVAAAKAAAALDHVQGAVQGKIDQVMGPVNDLTSKVQGMGEAMDSLGGGNLGAAAGLLGAAAALPSAAGFAGALGGGGGGMPGLAATNTAPGADASAGGIAGRNVIDQAVNGAIQKGVRGAGAALGAALGVGGAGGGGSSEANAAGPAGDVDGIDATDREKGPGHSTSKITGAAEEKVGSIKVTASLVGQMFNVAGNMKQKIGAARAELILGNRAESAEGNKTEKAIGLVILSGADETEAVSGTKMTMVGGAIVEKIAGGHNIVATGPASFVGALHKIEAKTAITLKCGDSEVVIDGSGVTMKAALVTFTAAKIQIPKATTEV